MKVFRTDLSAGLIQKRIRSEWRYCLEQYMEGSSIYDDKTWSERQCERAYTFGRAIGVMLTDDGWNEVFTDEFNEEWNTYHMLFLKSRDYLNSHLDELPFDCHSPF